MADSADQANDIVMAATDAAIQRARQGPFSHLRPTGHCVWCGEPVGWGRLHCRPIDDSCETDHLKSIRFAQGRMEDDE